MTNFVASVPLIPEPQCLSHTRMLQRAQRILPAAVSELLSKEEIIPLTSNLAVVFPSAVWQLYSPESSQPKS